MKYKWNFFTFLLREYLILVKWIDFFFFIISYIIIQILWEILWLFTCIQNILNETFIFKIVLYIYDLIQFIFLQSYYVYTIFPIQNLCKHYYNYLIIFIILHLCPILCGKSILKILYIDTTKSKKKNFRNNFFQYFLDSCK